MLHCLQGFHAFVAILAFMDIKALRDQEKQAGVMAWLVVDPFNPDGKVILHINS